MGIFDLKAWEIVGGVILKTWWLWSPFLLLMLFADSKPMVKLCNKIEKLL